MAYVLVHEEDWSSYGTDIDALRNAYPVWDGSLPLTPIGSIATTVGPTLGPNGGVGVSDLSGDHSFIPKNVAMTCRAFKIECLYDFTGWSPSGGMQSGTIFNGWHGYPYSASMSEFSDMLFQMAHHVSGNLTVFGNGYNSGTLTGVVPTSGNVQFRVEGLLSTISGSPGSFSAAADGYLKVYINESLVYDTGLIQLWHDDTSIPSVNAGGSYSPYWNIVELGLHGKVGLWRVYADDSCGAAAQTPRIDNSVPCCVETATPGGTNAGPILPPDPRLPLPVWTAFCDFGGLAPNGTDVINSEDWRWL